MSFWKEKMEFRNLGRTGLKVSCLCFGTDNFADPTPEEECVRMLDRALDAGINLLDTGDVYAEGEGERIIGPRTMEHLEDFLPVLDMELDDEAREACDRLVPPGSAVANYFNTSGWMRMKIL